MTIHGSERSCCGPVGAGTKSFAIGAVAWQNVLVEPEPLLIMRFSLVPFPNEHSQDAMELAVLCCKRYRDFAPLP